MKHNPFRIQHDALLTVRPQLEPRSFAIVITSVWAMFDDLTHDGYSVVDYEKDIYEAINEWGDVLQPDDVDDLLTAGRDDDHLSMYSPAENPDDDLAYLKRIADTVDDLYSIHGPIFINTATLDFTNELNFMRLSDEADLTVIMKEES